MTMRLSWFFVVALYLFVEHGTDGSRFPDRRLLEQHSAEGGIDDYFNVKFASLKNVSGFSINSIADELRAVEQAAQEVLDNLYPLCTSFEKVFVASEENLAAHSAYGLTRWVKFNCTKGSSSFSQTGQATIAALEQLRRLESNRLTEQLNQLNSSYNPWAPLEAAEAEYTIIQEVVSEEVLSSKQQRLRRNSARFLTGNGTTPLAAFPNDLRVDEQNDHFNLIKLHEAWDYMFTKGAWPNLNNIVMHVSDSGWDREHPDSQSKIQVDLLKWT